MLELSEAISEARRLSALIDAGVEALRTAAQEEANAEHDYRLAKARAWVTVAGELAKEREAFVDAETADARRLRDLSAGKREAARQALRAREAQLSALQSLLSASRTEMNLAR